MKRVLNGVLFSASLVCLVDGCGGAGTNSGMPPHPNATAIPTGTPATQSANIVFTVAIPASGTAAEPASRAHRLDTSASTGSVSVAIGATILATADVSTSSNICGNQPGGARTCTISVVAPVGSDTFSVTAYDQPNAKGNILAQGSVFAVVSSSSPQTVAVALDGTIVKLAIAISNPFPPVGTAATERVIVTGLDADGNIILGTFSNPVNLNYADASGATAISARSVTASSDLVTLTYNGTAPFLSTVVSASMTGVPTVSATFAPTPTFTSTLYQAPTAPPPAFFSPAFWSIAYGPDDNIWVAAQEPAGIYKVTPSGAMTAYPLSNPNADPTGLVLGFDGNLWFAEEQNATIGKIAPSTGAITEYPIPPDPSFPSSEVIPTCVALGADGNIWFGQYTEVANVPTPIDPAISSISPTGVISEYSLSSVSSNAVIQGITSGPDGNLWLADKGDNAIVEANYQGAVLRMFPIPTVDAMPWTITAGPDGNLWFTEQNVGKIGRITTGGSVSEFVVPSGNDSSPLDIVAGPNGRMWFGEMGAFEGFGKIGYVTTDGSQIRDFSPSADILAGRDGFNKMRGLTFDKHGTIWYADYGLTGGSAVGTFLY